jgi:hypothetical protein
MIEALFLLVSFLKSGFKNQTDLAFENLALRQQPAILKRNRLHARLRWRDRPFWACLYGENPRSWSNPKRSSDGIGKDLRYTGPIPRNITNPGGRKRAMISAISSENARCESNLGKPENSRGPTQTRDQDLGTHRSPADTEKTKPLSVTKTPIGPKWIVQNKFLHGKMVLEANTFWGAAWSIRA